MCALLNEKFHIHPRGKYDHNSTKISMPSFLGDYSVDGKRKFHHDQRNRNYIKMDFENTKEVNFDLNIGLESAIKRDKVKNKEEKLSNLMQWILLNQHKIQSHPDNKNHKNKLDVDFICFRGLLTTLLCTPYEMREGWIICATKFRGTIYMFAYDTPEKIEMENNRSDRENAMCAWGYKFEQYMNEGADTSTPVDENEEYMCVVRTLLGQLKLLYSPEVDGVDRNLFKENSENLGACIELKTNKLIKNERDDVNLHRFKFMKWWSQSYLAGIPRLVCGFRDEEGVVRTLKTYNVNSFPERSKKFWKSKIMLNFLNEFLTYIKQVVTEDDPNKVYKFCRPSKGDVITCTYYKERTEWNFIPEWYISKL